MTKSITKPIKKIVKPITKVALPAAIGFAVGGPVGAAVGAGAGLLKDNLKKAGKTVTPGTPALSPTGNAQLITADIKPDDPRKNLSEKEILANRKKKYRTSTNFRPGASLLTDQQYLTSTNFSNTIG
jgi:hypothetical protein